MFGKKNGERIELLSVHIPKTAGTSFRETLTEIYGEKAVLRADLPPEDQRNPEDPFPLPPEKLNQDVRVLHGHFHVPSLRERYPGIPMNVPTITWLRNPVDRVISNYYYLRSRIREEIGKSETLKVGITDRMLKSLLEYANQEFERNRMVKFLAGTKLSDFIFVGILETYTEDLRVLAKILEWPAYTEYFHNITENKYSDVTEEIRDQIRALNSLDWDLYQQAVEMREGRI